MISISEQNGNERLDQLLKFPWVRSVEYCLKPNSSDARALSLTSPARASSNPQVTTKVFVVNLSQGVPHFWDASDIVRERIKWGPQWFSKAGKAFDPSLCLACWTCASSKCWSKGSPSTLEVSNLTVVYFSELTPLKNIKVRPWLKNLFLSFKSLCLYDIVFH